MSFEMFEQPRRGALHRAAEERAPTVLIAHGFKGFMDWGMFPWIADRLAAAGFAAIRFDFAGNGVDERGDFTDLEGFRANTLGREQEDLGAMLDAVASGRWAACRPERIGLLGHSRGGGGVILKAAEDDRVTAVATLAAIARADRFPAEARAQAERDGFYPVRNARTGQELPVGRAYFEDAAGRDIPAAARAMGPPLLLVHGTDDPAVPIDEGRALARAHGLLFEIEGADHTFGARHPFAGAPDELVRAVDGAIEFFAETLR
ncbi:MAG: alpha/beta fold hydrolase [Planctomycetota bacterium]